MTESHTFLLADLATFTALTETRADEEIAGLARDFFAALHDLLGEYAAEEVNVIGDEVLLRSSDAGAAVRLAVRIVKELGAEHRFPMVRAGLHTGASVESGGHRVGSAANLATQVACLAAGGEILVSENTRAVVGELAQVEWRPRGPHPFEGAAEPVEIFVAIRSGHVAEGLVVDPVCGTAIEPGRAAGQLVHAGASFSFCSLRCAAVFASNPDSYASATASSRE